MAEAGLPAPRTGSSYQLTASEAAGQPEGGAGEESPVAFPCPACSTAVGAAAACPAAGVVTASSAAGAETASSAAGAEAAALAAARFSCLRR